MTVGRMVMTQSLTFGLAIAVLVPTALQAAEPATPTEMQTAESKSSSNAASIADRLIPNGPLIDVLLKAYEARYLADWKKGDGASVEAEYPGLYLASLTEGKNIYGATLTENLPQLKAEFQQLIKSRLSFTEIEQLHSFFQSETGARVMATIVNALSSGGTGEQMQVHAKEELRNTATAADTAAIMNFTGSNTFTTLQQLRVDFRPAIAAWHSEVNAKAEPLIKAGIEAAVQNHIDQLNGDKP
jgi:hypothetical protein